MTAEQTIAVAGESDLAELLALMRAYCDFYRVDPTDQALLALSRALIADPEREGIQLLARGPQREARGFATVFWSWDTTEAARIGVMNDLFVAPAARGSGLAERLILECAALCSRRGATRLDWLTAPENARAQRVYDRVGGVRGGWLTYSLRALAP